MSNGKSKMNLKMQNWMVITNKDLFFVVTMILETIVKLGG